MNGPGIETALVAGTPVLVTGATGTIGPTLVNYLTDQGMKVRVLLQPGIDPDLLPEDLEYISGDICDRDALKKAVRGIVIIFHLAAKLHIYDPDPKEEGEYDQINVLGTELLLQAAREAGVKRLVFFSTINVYGVSKSGQIFDEGSPLNPQNPYEKSKIEAEKAVLGAKFKDTNQPLGVVLRLGAVYGPSMKGNYIRMLKGLQQRWFLPIGPALNRRSLIYLDDAVRGAFLVSDHPDAMGNIYNLTDGGVYPLLKIITAMCASLGRSTPRIHLPVTMVRVSLGLIEDIFKLLGYKFPYGRRMIDVMLEDRAVSGEKIRRELGFQPQVNLEEGWKKVVAAVIERN